MLKKFEPRKQMQLIGMKLDDIPEEKIKEWEDLLNATPHGYKYYVLEQIKKTLDIRNRMESMIELKLDHIPDRQIIHWWHWVKHPFPESQSDVIRALKIAVFYRQGI